MCGTTLAKSHSHTQNMTYPDLMVAHPPLTSFRKNDAKYGSNVVKWPGQPVKARGVPRSWAPCLQVLLSRKIKIQLPQFWISEDTRKAVHRHVLQPALTADHKCLGVTRRSEGM